MNIAFPNKTIIVTGAAHGFGRAISLAFARLGAQVWACDVLADELAETQRLCREAGCPDAPGYAPLQRQSRGLRSSR
jgi:3-oxoacyl-[acyl-carrier protein] reductase